jgi:TPR repeat protein
MDRDDAEAITWFRKAADLEEYGAMSWLGSMYQSGRGVPKDDLEAVRWYRKSADGKNANAAYRLGLMYELNEARRWYQAAANGGNQLAKELAKLP